MLEVGAARVEIPVPVEGITMMGWGMLDNVVRGQATPLHARAFVMRDPVLDERVALVCCELAFISIAVKEGVCRRLRNDHPELGLDLGNVMLMATHTHSGPGGFTHYPFYNITIPGFVPEVYEAIVGAIVGAVVSAHLRLEPGVVRLGNGEFAPEDEVAFNRSIEAYNRNPDVTKVEPEQHHLAVNRRMTMLRFDRESGGPIGAINWFGVHCTSVHSDNERVHFDNKGYAAQFFERDLDDDFVGAFAQGAPGDVTPNVWRHPGRKWARGKFPDDDESARFNGEIQYRKAKEIFEQTKTGDTLEPRLRWAHRYVDFANIEVDPEYVDGVEGRRTGPAEIGWSMLFGTEEGPGLPRSLLFAHGVAARLRRALRREDDIQAEKITALQTGRRRFLGITKLRRLPLPWGTHPSLELVRELDQTGLDDPKPWTPNVLPVQTIAIGPVAIAAVPHECTTMCGRRLSAALKSELLALGTTDVVVASYANAYAGYVTTPEEYSVQGYEGGSTHFGKWTLPAWLTEFKRLAAELREPAPRSDPDLRPPEFSRDHLASRSYSG